MAGTPFDLEDLSFIDDTDEEPESTGNTETKEKYDKTNSALQHSNRFPNSKQLEEKQHKDTLNSEKENIQLSESCNDTDRLNAAYHQVDTNKKHVLKEEKHIQILTEKENQDNNYPVLVNVTVKDINMEQKNTSNTVTVELHDVGSPIASTAATYQQARKSSQVRKKLYMSEASDQKAKTMPQPNNDTTTEATADYSTEFRESPCPSPAVVHFKYDPDMYKDTYAFSDYEDSFRTESVTSPDFSFSHSDTMTSLQDSTMQSIEELPTETCSNLYDSTTEQDFNKRRNVLRVSKGSIDSVDGRKNRKSNKSRERPKDIGDLSGIAAPNRLTRKESKSIKIVVTNEEGVDEHLEDVAQKKRGHVKKELSPDSDSSGGSYSHQKKVIAHEKTSALEEVAPEVAKTKKTIKPFSKLQKLNHGCFELGIAGDRKRCNIKAITLMKDKRLVMFDRNNKCLKLFDKDFVPLDRLDVSVKFCGVASVFEHTVAVTIPEDKKLQLYHVNKNKFEKGRLISVEDEFYSLTHYKGKVYLLKRNPKSGLTEYDDWQIIILDLHRHHTDSFKTMKTFSPGHQDNTLLVNSSGLYMTHKLENEILHLGLDGSFKSRYKILMSLPIGITSDRYGNVYVCGGSVTSFIEVCKFNLKGSKIIYHKTSSDPVAMCFDKQDNMLFVCDKIQGNITKYKIEHNGTIQGLMKSFAKGENI